MFSATGLLCSGCFNALYCFHENGKKYFHDMAEKKTVEMPRSTKTNAVHVSEYDVITELQFTMHLASLPAEREIAMSDILKTRGQRGNTSADAASKATDEECLEMFTEEQKSVIQKTAMDCHDKLGKEMFAVNTGRHWPIVELSSFVLDKHIKRMNILQEHHGDVLGTCLEKWIRVWDDRNEDFRKIYYTEVGEYARGDYSESQKKAFLFYFHNTVVWQGSLKEVLSVERYLQNKLFPQDPNSLWGNRHMGGCGDSTTKKHTMAVSFVVFPGLLDAVKNGKVFFNGQNDHFVAKLIKGNPWLKNDKFFLKKNKEFSQSTRFKDEEEQELTGMGGEEE